MSIIGKYNQLGNNSRSYLIFISYFWLYGFFASLWRRVGVDPNIANLIILLILASICHGKWRNMVHVSDVFLYVSIVGVYLISALIYPTSKDLVIENAFVVLCVTAPNLFVGLIFKEEEYSYWLGILSKLAVLINVFFSILLLLSGGLDEESMYRAYTLLPSVLFILWQLFENYKKIDLLFFALGFFMICSMGTRGPFVCALFFALLYLVFFREWKHPTLMRVFLVVASIPFFVFASSIAVFMINILSYFGYSTRIFDSMLDNAFLNYENSNGRNDIQADLLSILNGDNSGIGFGLFSDRLFSYYGFSSHNIIVEMWFSFGYYIGSVLLGIIILLIIRFFIKTQNNHSKVFCLIIFTCSFVKLMFSGSFILDGLFFFLIGYCIKGLRTSNYSLKTYQY